MAHIHLPTVFSLQWVIIWRALALIVIAIALLIARRRTFITQQLTTAALLAGYRLQYFKSICRSPAETWLTTMHIQKGYDNEEN